MRTAGRGWACRLWILTAATLSLGAVEPSSQRIRPEDLVYLGAFRLPRGDPASVIRSWAYGGQALTYYPRGDPLGGDDNHPGSLFAAGHAWSHLISEITIPAPVSSPQKNPAALPEAAVLQPFQDILEVGHLEIPRTGLAWLPPQVGQATSKLHFCWGHHMQDGPPALTHGWCETNLSQPRVERGWALAGLPSHLRNMSTNDYLCAIPPEWAAVHAPDLLLATGRFRDGGWSGRGPALFAIGPWNHGNPPPSGSEIAHLPLILYTSTCAGSEEPLFALEGYHHSDEWTGAAWLTGGGRSALLFVGTKGRGECWYGGPGGPGLDVENRGWWSDEFQGLFLFFDTEDLADVAAGRLSPGDPQPYAVLEVDPWLFGIGSIQQKHHLGACTFDSDHGLLYVFEPFGDGEKPLIHVWRLSIGGDVPPGRKKTVVIRK